MDFLLTELELVIVTGLDMYPFYAKLEKKIVDLDEHH